MDTPIGKASGRAILSLKRAQSPRPTEETLHSRNETLSNIYCRKGREIKRQRVRAG